MADTMADDVFSELPDLPEDAELRRCVESLGDEVIDELLPLLQDQPSSHPLGPTIDDVNPSWMDVREPVEHLSLFPQAAAPMQMNDEILDVQTISAELFGKKTNDELEIDFIEQVLTRREELMANGVKHLQRSSLLKPPSVTAHFVLKDGASDQVVKKRKAEAASSSTEAEELVGEATSPNGLGSGTVHPSSRDKDLGIVKLSAKKPPDGLTVNYWGFVVLKQPLETSMSVRLLNSKGIQPEFKEPKVLLVRSHPSFKNPAMTKKLDVNDLHIKGTLMYQGKELLQLIEEE
ncbi:MAG: hypothetical protein SGPRY_014626, partial [Prymnesium sp.]